MRSAVGAVYQTVTRCSARIRYQRSASISSSSTMVVTPWVSGAITPYEVPVTQPGSAVHQYTSSGCRSRAAVPVAWCAVTASCTWMAPFGVPVVPLREVQQGHVLGLRRGDRAVGRRRTHQRREIQGIRLRAAVGVDEQDVPEFRERVAEMGDLLAVKRPGGDQRPAGAELQPLADGFRAERGEQRAEDAGVLEGAQHRNVQRRSAPGEREDPLAAPDAEARAAPRQTGGLLGEVGVGQRVAAAVGPDEPQRLGPRGPPAACRSTAS